MIQMIGIRKNVKVHIREKLSIMNDDLESVMDRLRVLCKEVVVISTCNRTEIYYIAESNGAGTIGAIFEVLRWDKAYTEHVFHLMHKDAVKHLLEVACGFHSKILGEDQILGQIKNAFGLAKQMGTSGKYLSKLFQTAITCSKQFRNKSQLHRFPVSSSSIVVREAKQRNVRKYMVLGYGDVGKLTAKYILDSGCEQMYIAVRNPEKVDISGHNIKVIDFAVRNNFYQEVECIISCTAAPHTVVKKEDLPGNHLLIFDLAVPRDVEENTVELDNVMLYDIDKVSALSNAFSMKRKDLMESYRYIISEAIVGYLQWLDIDRIAPVIHSMKEISRYESSSRLKSFKNKMHTRNHLELAEMLIESASNEFVHRAIDVLKDEYKNGRGEECLELVRKIFRIEP